MATRARPAGQDERRFRAANEELRQRYELVAAGERDVPFLCECADARCTRVVVLALGEYADVRARGDRFVVLPGHLLGDSTEVVERRSGYDVVRHARPPHRPGR